MSERLAKNAISSVAGWFISVLAGVVLTPLTVHTVGTERYGIYALIIGFGGLYNPFDLGLGLGITKEIAARNAAGEIDSLRKSIESAVFFALLLGILIGLALLYFLPDLARLYGSPAATPDETRYSLLFGAALFGLSVFASVLNATLMGFQKYHLCSISNIVYAVGSASVVLGLALLDFPLPWLVFAPLTLLVGVTAVLWRLLMAQLPGVRIRPRIHREETRRLFRFSNFAFLSQLSTIFATHFVRTWIGVGLGAAAITYFVVSSKLLAVFGGFLGSAFGVLVPHASDLSAKNQHAQIQSNYTTASRLFAAIAFPPFLAIALFARPILTLWMGEAFAAEAHVLLTILALSTLMASLTTVPNLITLGLGRSKLVGVFAVATTVVYAVLLPPATKAFGILGVGYVALLATLPGVVLVSVETRRVLKLSVIQYMLGVFRFHALPVVCAAGLGYLVYTYPFSSNLLAIAAGAVLVGMYYAVMLWTRWVDPASVRKVLDALWGRIVAFNVSGD